VTLRAGALREMIDGLVAALGNLAVVERKAPLSVQTRPGSHPGQRPAMNVKLSGGSQCTTSRSSAVLF